MDIINSGAGRIQGGSIRGTDFEQARELRRAQLDTKVQEATLTPARQFNSQEIREHNTFYNGVVADVDRLKEGRLGTLNGMMGIGCLFPIFETPGEHEVREATKPNIADNDKARDVKDEYRKNLQEARHERAQADKIAGKLGPGHHKLSNGDEVNVTTDSKTGRTTVSTTHPDGSTKSVRYDKNNPDNVTVNTRTADGKESRLRQHGSDITRSETDPFGQKTETKYSVDDEGRPVREKQGPNSDDYEKTSVNDDGSTDSSKLIYNDDDGNPVYEDTHEDSRFGDIFGPFNPWRPWPGPYPWENVPFGAQQQ